MTSTAGMTAVVLGLVEVGTAGWSAPITVVSLVAGLALVGLFVRIETTAADPIPPLRILADRTRAAARRGPRPRHAGMYKMVLGGAKRRGVNLPRRRPTRRLDR